MAETIVETARLRLRTWDDRDLDAVVAALDTPAVARWLGGVQGRDNWQLALQRMQLRQAQDGYCFWLVDRLADDVLLGFCGIKQVDCPDAPFCGETEIGWRLREDAWGHGYAREAAEASLTQGFCNHGLARIHAMTVRQNAPSWGLMQRLGMVRARALDFSNTAVAPDISDHIVYSIDKGDWTQ